MVKTDTNDKSVPKVHDETQFRFHFLNFNKLSQLDLVIVCATNRSHVSARPVPSVGPVTLLRQSTHPRRGQSLRLIRDNNR